MSATESTIFAVELIMLRKIITALILKRIPSIVKHALNNLFARFVTIVLFTGLLSSLFLKLSDLKIRRKEAMQRGWFCCSLSFSEVTSNFYFCTYFCHSCFHDFHWIRRFSREKKKKLLWNQEYTLEIERSPRNELVFSHIGNTSNLVRGTCFFYVWHAQLCYVIMF